MGLPLVSTDCTNQQEKKKETAELNLWLGCKPYDVFHSYSTVPLIQFHLQYTWIVKSVLLGGVGIASSDMILYQMCILKKKKKHTWEGVACYPMQYLSKLYTFIFWPECCPRPWSRPNNLKAQNIFLSFFFKISVTEYSVDNYSSFSTFPIFSLLNVRVAFFRFSQLFLFIFGCLYYYFFFFYRYLCCALALLWRLLVESGGTSKSHINGKGKVLISEVKTFFVLVPCLFSFRVFFFHMIASVELKWGMGNPVKQCDFFLNVLHNCTF